MAWSRSQLRTRLLGAALLSIFPLSLAWKAVHPAARLEYTVAPASSGIDIELQWHGLDLDEPPTLARLAPSGGPRVVDVTARDRRGRPLPVVSETRHGDPARWHVQAPARLVARIRYRVTDAAPTARGMEDDVAGSVLGSSWSLIRGRDLLLVPLPAERFKAVNIRLRPRAGTVAVAPWCGSARGQDAQPVGGGLEEALATPMAFGRFEERAFDLGLTRYRVYLETSIPGADRARIVSRLAAVARDLGRAVSRPLGRTYTVIATPAADEHGAPSGEAWGSGQGGAFWPLTTTRLRAFALGLADAYFMVRPHRFELDAVNESWLAPSLRSLFAERAVAHARGLEPAEVDRVLAYRYATLPETMREDLDLERVLTPFPTREGQIQAVENAGPYLLASLDRELRSGDRTRSPLADALRKAARHDHVASFWDAFDTGDRRRIDAYRARFVRGRELLDVSVNRDASELRPAPPFPVFPVVRRAHLAATGQTLGYLEPCGCRVNQAGGVAKRARRIAELRARHPELLMVDVGSAFGEPTQLPVLDPFARAELELYLGLVAEMGYDALTPGGTELARGPALLTALGAESGLPYTAANLRRGRAALAPAARVVERGGIHARIVGVYEPPVDLQRPSMLDASLDSLEIEGPVETVIRAFANSRADEIGIVLGELSYRTVREIARRCPTVDVIVTSPDRVRGELTAIGAGSSLSPVSGFLDHTFVLYADLGEYGLEVLDLGLDAQGHVVEAHVAPQDLGEEVREDPAVRTQLDRFYTTVARAQAASAQVEIPAAADPERRGGYAGRQACAACHASETAQWEATAHARAFKTLLDAHRHYQPRCVSCHVVGFGAKDGYQAGSRKLADVQCESCHGPGAAHVRDPRRGTIARAVPERVCLSCHTAEHSEAFVYADRLPRVTHASPMVSRAGEDVAPRR